MRWAQTGGAIVAALALQVDAQPSILVGPDILVSRLGSFPHVELTLASNPTNANNLIGAAISGTQLRGGMATTIYTSVDGGSSWIPTFLPEPLLSGALDPQVAFSRVGTAYFAALLNGLDDHGRTVADLNVYRSTDGGLTWEKPISLGHSYDHDMLAVDRTAGPYADRVYIGCLEVDGDYRIVIFRSDHGGRTFRGPVRAVRSSTRGINVVNLLVLSDGTLFVPYFDFDYRDPASTTGTIWFVTSRDGGQTFSKPQRILTRNYAAAPVARFHRFPVFAVDEGSARLKDRIYVSWSDMRTGRPAVFFSYSADRGRTWSEPSQIRAVTARSSDQFQPALAVNPDGVVGLSWYDTLGSDDGKGFNEYFTASVDGGASFLEPVRVSTRTSVPFGGGNIAPMPTDFRTQDSWRISLLSAASRWPHGGDYMGLAADATGAFHPFWADARSGTFQAWTATVRVGTKPAAVWTGPGSSAPVSLRSLVGLVYDPVSYDEKTGILQMPVRLKNHSSQHIFPPIEVEIVRFGSGANADINAANAPTILNASSGRTGVGARFDYSSALGDFGSLAPDGQTAAVVWKMRVKDVLRIPNLHVKVTGRVELEPQP